MLVLQRMKRVYTKQIEKKWLKLR